MRDVEFLGLAVSENAVQLGTRHAVGPTKGRKARSVPVPAFVLDELSAQTKGKAPGDLVFAGRDGGYLPRPKSSTGRFQAAVKRAGVQTITPHDLRHTCASLAVSAGVNVLALQRMLGHTSAKMTLDTYSDLFDDDLDAVAVTLHSRYSRENVAKCGHAVATTVASKHRNRVYLHGYSGSCRAGEGTRTLKLSRARAPKTRAFSISPRPQRADRTASLADESVGVAAYLGGIAGTEGAHTHTNTHTHALGGAVRHRKAPHRRRCKRLRDRSPDRRAASDSPRLAAPATNSPKASECIALRCRS